MNAIGERPVVNESRCIGCGDCVAVCPTNCLAMAAGRPWMPRPGDCIACGACEAVCPTEAIQLKPPVRE